MDPTLETVKANLAADANRLAAEINASGHSPQEIEQAQANLEEAKRVIAELGDLPLKLEIAKANENTLKLLGVELQP